MYVTHLSSHLPAGRKASPCAFLTAHSPPSSSASAPGHQPPPRLSRCSAHSKRAPPPPEPRPARQRHCLSHFCHGRSRTLAPGGSFEGSTPNGHSPAAPSRRPAVRPTRHGILGTSSLALPAKASAQSPFVCISSTEGASGSSPAAKRPKRPSSRKSSTTPLGNIAVPVGKVTAKTSWAPSAKFVTGAALGTFIAGGTSRWPSASRRPAARAHRRRLRSTRGCASEQCPSAGKKRADLGERTGILRHEQVAALVAAQLACGDPRGDRLSVGRGASRRRPGPGRAAALGAPASAAARLKLKPGALHLRGRPGARLPCPQLLHQRPVARVGTQPLRGEARVEIPQPDTGPLAGRQAVELVKRIAASASPPRRGAEQRQALQTLGPGDGELLRHHSAELMPKTLAVAQPTWSSSAAPSAA